MRKSSKALAYSALGAALGSVLLYLASVLPSGRLTVVCVASVCVVVIACLFGWRWGSGCFVVTAVISLLILPSKAMAILYTAFFGYYPLVFLLTERMKSRMGRYAVRMTLFNAVMIALYFLVRSVFQGSWGALEGYPLVVLLLANAGFLIYDYALQQGMLYFMRNIARRVK